MKKTKKLISLMLALVMLLTTISTVGMTAFAAYGSDGDIHKYYFSLDRIPGVDGYPDQALDRTVSVSNLKDKDGDGFGNDMWEDLSYYTVDVKRNGVSTSDTTIKPDSTYTYIIHVYCDDDYDVVYYGYNSSTEVWWNGQKYNSTYDAGHSGTSGYTWSRFGFTTPKTPSKYTPATVVEDELVYNGSTQRLLNDDEYLSDNTRIDIQYKVDDGIWVNDPSLVVAKNAGTHTISWTASGVGYNNNITSSGTMTKEIKKLKATVTPKADQSKIYGMNDPTFDYTIQATNGALVVPGCDKDADGRLLNGALSRVEGENYNKNGYKYTIGTLQEQNAVNYDLTFVDDTTVFMINRKNITAGGVDATLSAPDGGFDGDIYQYYYKHGDEIIPAISLIYSGAEVPAIQNESLVLNKDYNITDGKTVREYINHGNSNEVITVRGIGNYIGVTTLDWRVIKLNFGEITSDKYEATYDGEEHSMTVNLTDAAIAADAEITYIYDAGSDTVYNADNWDYEKATTTNPAFKDVLVDDSNNQIARTVYYRVHSEKRDDGGSLIYNDFYGSEIVFIKKKNVNLVAENKTKVYDKDPSTDPALTYESYADQMIGEETLAGIEMSRVEGQNVSNYAISFNLDTINLLNTNYNVTESKGNFAITPRPVKVAVGDYEKIYSEVNPTLALDIENDGDEGVAPLEGLVAGDVLFDETLLGTTLEFIDANNKVWAYDRFIDAGEYEIRKGTLANNNYDITFTNGSFTVHQKDISLPDTNVVMLYNGSRIDPVFSYTGKTIQPEFTLSDLQDNVEYVNYEDDIDFEVKGVFKASDYGIFNVSIKGIHNYTGEIRGKWAILPIIDKTVDYDGNSHSLECNLGESLNDATALGIVYSTTEPTAPVTADDYNLTEIPSYTQAGVYNLYYGVIQNPEEYGQEGVFAGVATLTINKIAQSAIVDENKPVANEGLVYNKTAQALVTAPATLPTGCDHIEYSLDGETWSAEIPAQTNADDYTVKVKYVGDNNHFDQDGEDIAVSIAVRTIEPTIAIDGWTYGDAANEPVVTGNFDDAQATIVYKEKDASDMGSTEEVPTQAGDYTVEVIIAATDNCTGGSATADFTIAKRPITITAENKTIKKDEEFKPLTYTIDGTVVEGDDLGIRISSKAKASTPGKYDITVTCANKNYDATLVKGTYTVTDRVSPKEKTEGKNKVNSVIKATPAKNGNVTVSWGAVKGAEKYEIYAAYCENGNPYKLVKTVDGSANSFTITKLNGKKINNRKCMKTYVVAYRKVNGKDVKIASSVTLHIAGTAARRTNAKSVTVKNDNVKLKVNKTSKIKATLIRENKNKKAVDHVAKFRYQSTNTSVATVDENGKITAVGKGKCSIYIFANNGKMKTVKVTVE